MMRKPLAQLLKLSLQLPSAREVGRRPQVPQPLGLPQARGLGPPQLTWMLCDQGPCRPPREDSVTLNSTPALLR